MLLGRFHFTITGLVLLDERLVLNLVVVDFTFLLRELYLYLVSFLNCSLVLSNQDVLVKLDFLLPLLHAHLHLVLLVL